MQRSRKRKLLHSNSWATICEHDFYLLHHQRMHLRKRMDRILYRLYLKLQKHLDLQQDSHLVEDSLFYNKDYKEAMQLHIATLKTIPEDILVDMIEMLNLNRYQTYVSMIQHNDPANKFQHIAKSNELK